jgi:hypothetical protein
VRFYWNDEMRLLYIDDFVKIQEEYKIKTVSEIILKYHFIVTKLFEIETYKNNPKILYETAEKKLIEFYKGVK